MTRRVSPFLAKPKETGRMLKPKALHDLPPDILREVQDQLSKEFTLRYFIIRLSGASDFHIREFNEITDKMREVLRLLVVSFPTNSHYRNLLSSLPVTKKLVERLSQEYKNEPRVS